MKCPKCGFTSFPYLESCRKCGLEFAEPQAALGFYALPPNPPDLLLAYQTTPLEVAGPLPMPPASTPSLDIGSVDEIGLEIAQARPITPDRDQSEEPMSPFPDALPTLAQEITTAAELPPLEPSAEPRRAAETVMPPTLDLSELADMTLELDHTVTLGDNSAQSSQVPKDSSEEPPVYDLDLDDDLDGLTLRPVVDESSTGDAHDGEQDIVEYTLEIEDDLEFEIDGLELEQSDDTEDEDDDKA